MSSTKEAVFKDSGADSATSLAEFAMVVKKILSSGRESPQDAENSGCCRAVLAGMHLENVT